MGHREQRLQVVKPDRFFPYVIAILRLLRDRISSVVPEISACYVVSVEQARLGTGFDGHVGYRQPVIHLQVVVACELYRLVGRPSGSQ
ncbi:hypothetical protein SDC9_161418 [bioreactor metagenome]|uniref:Uncharacterized protein n=1 Tax=bioreactor metagenome TaxID=1076179 RepID=A0A645FKK3_9ZZZZ